LHEGAEGGEVNNSDHVASKTSISYVSSKVGVDKDDLDSKSKNIQ
jgi:hypothetical protein